MKFIITLFIILFVLSGCYYDKEELLYGVNLPCDTTSVTFSATVNSILSRNGCMNCHSGNSPAANINLQGYTNVKAAAAGNRLLGSISHTAGFAPMPQGGNKMSSCDISKIKSWIDNGMINN